MVNQNDINCPVAAVVKTAMVTPEIAALHPPREKGRSTTMLGHSATCLVGKSGTLVGAQHGAAFVLSEGMPFSSFFDLFCSSLCPFLYNSFAGRATSPRRSKLSVAGTVVGSSSPISSGPPISKNPPG